MVDQIRIKRLIPETCFKFCGFIAIMREFVLIVIIISICPTFKHGLYLS